MQASFRDYQLSSEILKALEMLNFQSPTRVQAEVIPAILEKKDIIVKSQTGSGKTAAFAIPLCELIDWDENKPQALVLVPTRELAIQVKEDIFNVGRFKRIKVPAIFGKAPFLTQEKELKQKTHVVVGTPGRVIDHIDRGTLDTSKIKYLVIDEADEMLNMGFIEDLKIIIGSLPVDRVTLLLSATLPKDIVTLCEAYLKNPLHVEIEEENAALERIYQARYVVGEEQKLELFQAVTILENPDSCIVFCNTKQRVDELYGELLRLKYSCQKLHGGMEQPDRLRIMKAFKQGYFRYLIATDVAARGLDIENISLVINYDIPQDKESYVHRIGRTGRISKEGRALTLMTPREGKFLEEIERYIGKEIPLQEAPAQEVVESHKPEFLQKMNTRPQLKEEKGAPLGKEIMKLHINAGKKTKMRPVDIVGTLCNIPGMTAEDIGIINVLDISTFVEILNGKGEMVLKELQNMTIKGRPRKVSKADR